MVKKCIVKYDELGKPIELIELKEFNDPKVLGDFKEQCLVNKKDYLKRLEDAAKEKEQEKKQLDDRLNKIDENIAKLFKIAKHLLGYEELSEEELQELLGVEEHEEEK